jgi:ABC-2 type transport system ATP-binding protein
VLIEVEGVRHRYASAGPWALDGVSVRVARGVLLGLVGPNGSGKTTLYRLVLGFLRPTAGCVRVSGLDPAAYRARHGIGYLPEQVGLPAGVRVREFALLMARLAGLKRGVARAAIDRLMHTLAIEERADATISTLSHGYRQRVGLLAALLGEPELLLLDEPANGLDPVSVGILRSVLRGLKREGRTVIVSTHNLLELERVCDEALILSEGRILGRSSREELLRRSDVWVVQTAGPIGDGGRAVAALSARLGAIRLAMDEVAFENEDRAREFAGRVAAVGGEVTALERRPFDLECLFHTLTQRRFEEGGSP